MYIIYILHYNSEVNGGTLLFANVGSMVIRIFYLQLFSFMNEKCKMFYLNILLFWENLMCVRTINIC